MAVIPHRISAYAEKVTQENRPETLFFLRYLWNREEVSIFTLIYAYFRWLDDYVDLSPIHRKDKIRFVDQQWAFWRKQYRYKYNTEVSSSIYSSILRWIVIYDLERHCVLHKQINRLFNAIMYDAKRQYNLEPEDALIRYSFDIGGAYTTILRILSKADAISGYEAKSTENAGFASHQIHILRDFWSDIKLGFFNISKQDVDSYRFSLDQTCDSEIRPWVCKVVDRAQNAFDTGISAINSIHSLKCKFLLLFSLSPYLSIMESIIKNNYDLRCRYSLSRYHKTRCFAWALFNSMTPFNKRSILN